MEKIPKWGFGAAPLKPETLSKYSNAIIIVINYVLGKEGIEISRMCDDLSILKGMFNRIIKQDQWDWFTVSMYFDYPNLYELRQFVNFIVSLRRAILEDDSDAIVNVIAKLSKTNFLLYINNFLNFDLMSDSRDEYIYILSSKKDKNLLKIGRTSRNVYKRAQEINSATGVLYPISPRKAFRVINSVLAEKLVHNALSEHRVRADREFFYIEYSKACETIENCLIVNELLYYKYVNN